MPLNRVGLVHGNLYQAVQAAHLVLQSVQMAVVEAGPTLQVAHPAFKIGKLGLQLVDESPVLLDGVL